MPGAGSVNTPKASRRDSVGTRERGINTPSTTVTRKYLPKKSAYFSVKPTIPSPQKKNSNNNTNKPDVKHIPSPAIKNINNTKQASPRKATFVTEKTNTPSAQANNANNSSNKGTGKVAKDTKVNETEKATSPRNDSIFVNTTRNYSDIAADVIRADSMNHGYKIEKTIGEGAYAKVKLAEVMPSKLARNESLAELADGQGNLRVAIKVIDNKNVPKEFLKKFLPRELGNHCPLPPHPNVVRVHEQFKTSDRYYVVMEYCSKGDLLDRINHRISESCKGIGEDVARKLFTMMVDGVHHIHTNGIVHRDLKCENILLDHTDTIKITDFGFSTKFVPDKSALLKTSCGSYAYTAPEVIKMKPYDGTKSDTWSLGVILFAMLNGRLPFNDAQLADLEEDMKMQRLRFERTVSFESMVLVRRILQYNPANRPTTGEILNDPWLTGKRLIPRQVTKPKWINPYQANKEESEVEDVVLVGTKPVYYKSTIPERGSEATVTVNHDRNEQVVLKSRTRNKKNIWTSGPPVSPRPNTWPRSVKDKERTKTKRNQTSRARARPRETSASCQKTNTTIIVKQPVKTNKCQTGNGGCKTRVGYTKWYMEKYMTNCKGSNKHTDVNSDCRCCKAEAMDKLVVSCDDGSVDLDDELCLLEQTDAQKQVAAETDDVRWPSPVKNIGDVTYDSNIEKNDQATEPQKREIKPDAVKPEFRVCATDGCQDVCNRRSATVSKRKAPVKSASAKNGSHADKTAGSTSNGATASKSMDMSKKCLVNYMVNHSTSPAERVKYFRDRLMKLYGNEKPVEPDVSGLPPLMVQSIKPPKDQPAARETPAQPVQSTPLSRPTGPTASTSTWCSRRGSAGTRAKVKPVQRIIVHSAVL